MTSARFSVFNLGYFLVATVMVFVLSAIVAFALSSMGWDPRGSLVGPYQERNAILVGCILGFAIIPIIYTISEDALQSVPQHLRSASLGCGATTWQTTIRVVVPTAMSGLFSALMIGFGRAVGETMVVLMAAGNTPLMDINPMNGYRTMSATLATELPEAARGSTHYHGLFLAALLLFCFTLVANTLAELVRMRFRKRAFQL
jgi:phosphate transport system permease protein